MARVGWLKPAERVWEAAWGQSLAQKEKTASSFVGLRRIVNIENCFRCAAAPPRARSSRMRAPTAAHTRKLCAGPLQERRRPTNAPPHRPAHTPAPRPALPPPSATASPSRPSRPAPTNMEYDAVIVGGGFGGLTVASQLAAAGRSVVVLEAYIIPGGSGGHFEAGGCTFDVGASMMFGLGAHGTTNLITRALAAVGKEVETVPDPTQIHYHLPASPAHPSGLEVKVWRSYDAFVKDLVSKFPHEEAGIKRFYGECWRVFDSLNALDLKSLEEPRYLLGGESVCVCEGCGWGKGRRLCGVVGGRGKSWWIKKNNCSGNKHLPLSLFPT